MSLSGRQKLGVLAIVGLGCIAYDKCHDNPRSDQAISTAASATADKLRAFLLPSADAAACVPREKIARGSLNDSDYPYKIIHDISDLHKACDPIKKCSRGGVDVSCSGEDKRIVCVDSNSMGKAILSDTEWTCSNTADWRDAMKTLVLTTDGRRRSGDSDKTCYVSPLLCAEK